MQVMFNVLMGLRRSKINGVKYSDVDYINRTLKVERQPGRVSGSGLYLLFQLWQGKEQGIPLQVL